jgi:hypothetical protein
MANYLVVRVMEPTGLYRPAALALGDVEIRKPDSDSKMERKALEASKAHYKVASGIDGIAMRICTIVEAVSAEEADRFAFQRFEEAQDILQHTTMAAGLIKLQLTECGFSRNLDTGELQSRDFTGQNLTPTSYPVFHVVENPFPPIDNSQLFFALPQCDLKESLKRSFYWSRKAKWESDRQLRLLFRWFAMEAVWMVGKDDDISPRILWSMGFPNGSGAAAVRRDLVIGLNSDPRYDHWKKRLAKAFSAIKSFRNDTVHSGFRPVDLPDEKLREFDHFTNLACPRVQGLAYSGLQANLTDSKELLEYVPLLLERHVNPEGMHKTLIPLLQNPPK